MKVRCRFGYEAKTERKHVTLIYAETNGEFDSAAGAKLAAGHVSRLCYSVPWSGGIVYIDAKTGECLGGHVAGKS